MPVDLVKIRELLASVVGFTKGPWSPDDELGWIRPPKGLQITGYVQRVNRPLIAAAPDLHRDLAAAVGEIERLRAHNARMVAQINALANACDAAMSSEDGPLVVCDALPGRRWSECTEALRRLAAGEVDDV